MHTVILGAGVVGYQIAEQLIAEGKDVVILEKNPERAKFISEHLDCMVINDDGTNVSSLKRAGTKDASIFISVTNSDEVNMIACGLVASEFNVPLKIARVRNIDYSKSKIMGKSFLGIDLIVNSEVETARQIANTIALGADSDVMFFENTDLQMRNIVVTRGSYFANKTVKDIRKGISEPFLISGIMRNNDFLIPTGDTIVREGDNIYLMATQKNFTRIFIQVGKKQEKIDRIVIIGGGRVGSLACEYLIRTGRKITVVETDYERCKFLADKFPDALILNADISDESVFHEEEIAKHDLIVTVTDNQELNMLISLYAKSMGIKRSIALVTNSSYLAIASRLDIDVTVNPKLSTVDAIMKFIRRGNIKSLHSIFHGRAEVIEFSVDEKNPLVGKPLKEMLFPKNSIILSVVRNNTNILPHGNIVIEPNDLVIIIAEKTSIPDLEQFIQG
ncbi:MAG TPA: Trk system potassium transporter TrkA [Spirochaetota bacterium]|nr:Trk system potassium transporter TrkA [Spirochaetota bacterium]HOM09651.1 Trk system potassium transporter TrkA [Spirochaetota bacterium]HPP50420.1 Trk system potassium transporter TrkA [Spirochaetota bacterium]